jgi:hypothetical protein
MILRVSFSRGDVRGDEENVIRTAPYTYFIEFRCMTDEPDEL